MDTFELRNNAFAEIALVHLPIIERIASTIAVQKRLHQLFLVLVLGLLISLFDPILRLHLLDLQRKESGENSISGILSGRRQNRGVLLFMLHGVELAD